MCLSAINCLPTLGTMVPTKKQIIKRIRSLYRQQESLNITAVRRNHPALLNAAFAVEPFWGWRQALEDSGIGYDDISIHLEDHVICRICGAERSHLGSHIKLLHGCDAEDYRHDYPDSELVCEELRAKLMSGTGGGRCLVPHWEPLWTAEYVLDRTAWLHMQGFPVNHEHLSKVEAIVHQGLKRFGSWDAVLMRVGLDPMQIRLQRPTVEYSRSETIRGIRRRQKAGLPMLEMSLRTGPHVDSPLSRAAKVHFGTWRNALRAAGLDTTSSYGIVRFPDAESVCEDIRRRQRDGQAIGYKAMRQPGIGDKRLFVVACELFGAWENAIKAAGLDYSTIRQRKRFPYRTKAAVIRELRARRDRQEPLTTNGVRRGKYRDVALMESALKLFGKWSAAKRAAGVLTYDHRSL